MLQRISIHICKNKDCFQKAVQFEYGKDRSLVCFGNDIQVRWKEFIMFELVELLSFFKGWHALSVNIRRLETDNVEEPIKPRIK